MILPKPLGSVGLGPKRLKNHSDMTIFLIHYIGQD